MKRNASGALYEGVVFGVALTLAAAGAMAPRAASAATIWQPVGAKTYTSNATYLLSLWLGASCTPPSTCTNGITNFGIFRPGTTTLDAAHGLMLSPTSDSVTFTAQGSNWLITNSTSGSFTLLGSNAFVIGATTGASWVLDSGYRYAGADQYSVYFPTGSPVPTTTLQVSGLAAVPLPAALWLFVSGFIGMVGVARRRSDRRQADAGAPASLQRRRTDRSRRAALVAALFARPGG